MEHVWQELGTLAVNAAAAHGSCFLLGHALRSSMSGTSMREPSVAETGQDPVTNGRLPTGRRRELLAARNGTCPGPERNRY